MCYHAVEDDDGVRIRLGVGEAADDRAAVLWAGCMPPAVACAVSEFCVGIEARVKACTLASAARLRRLLLTSPKGLFVSVDRGMRGRTMYALSGLPTRLSFVAASAGCRGMRT